MSQHANMSVEIHVIAGPAKGQVFRFDKPDCFLFGRTRDAHVSLPDDLFVSRHHFLLEISPPNCKLTDLDSKNGVFVNGIRYGGRKPAGEDIKTAPEGVKDVALKDGDEIMVGATRMTIVITGAQHESNAQQTPSKEQMKDMLRNLLAEKQAKSSQKQVVPEPFSLEGYELETILRKSGTGMIYKAKERNSGGVVAIKTLILREDLNIPAAHIFRREVTILQQLKHKNIVRFVRRGKSGPYFYFIFEFVEGPNVAEFIRQHGGRLSVKSAVPIMLDTLNGLAYAHQAKVEAQIADGDSKMFRGVVHRNIKPQNILLSRQGNQWVPKIADFGLSKTFDSAEFTEITEPGTVFGTPVYWPREQITHYKYLHPVTDVFSVAAVFYEMLTGARIRDGFTELFHTCRQEGRFPTLSDYLNVIANHPPVPIRQRNPHVPKPLAQVIDRALREIEIPHERAKMQHILKGMRYPDAGAFRNALIQALREMEKSARKSTRHIRPPTIPISTAPSSHPPSSGAVMFSGLASKSRQEVGLFILDMVHSTQYILQRGDTSFSELIGHLFQHVKSHPSSSELIFLKSTGDGFLAVFQSVAAAFSLARSFLDTPPPGQHNIPIRMGIHWGTVMTGPTGDIIGSEVHRVYRIEGIQQEDQVVPAASRKTLVPENRLLITTQALRQLHEADRRQFQAVGKFRLKGFEKLCELWMLQK